jgi:Ca2+-binding EF-hand superfamily protein
MRKLHATLTVIAVGAFLPCIAEAQPAGQRDPMETIMSADKNNDGAVSRDEFLASRAQTFARLDRNGDETISKADLPRFKKMQEKAGPRIDSLIQAFDSNGDGRVSEDEFVSGPTPAFDMADADQDGFVTREEAEAAQAALKAQRAQN